jgi:subtilisin family serine protease
MSLPSSLAWALEMPLAELASLKLDPVDVAVVDSGIDATHPALCGRVHQAWRFRMENALPHPVKLPQPGGNDDFGHGTGIAGVIARLAPNARLHDVRVLGSGAHGSGAELAAGLRIAVRERFPIINMSLAAPAKYANELSLLCERAWYQGQIVIAAKRNVPVTDYGFPAEFCSCIGVDSEAFDSPFSFRFRDAGRIEIAAQGENIATTALGHAYTSMTGTSFATATVSALCARLLGAYPGLRPFEIRAILRQLAMKEPSA